MVRENGKYVRAKTRKKFVHIHPEFFFGAFGIIDCDKISKKSFLKIDSNG